MWKRTKRTAEINPEEIFLDASNLPAYEAGRLEGRITQPIGRRSFLPLLLVLCVVFGGTVLRSGQLMVVEGASYRELSEGNRLGYTRIPAERGVVYDRNGTRLAWNVPHLEAGIDTPYHERRYHVATGTSHLLGYVRMPARDANGVYFREGIEGVAGVELAFDELLRGVDGRKIVETDARMEVVSEGWVERPLPGSALTLTIDARLNEALHGFIAALAQDVPFRGGAGVVMDVESGEVLALTSVPEYDPSALVLGEAARIAEYANDERTPYLNRVFAGQYTPGSIVKPFMASAALEEGIVEPSKRFLSTGALRLANPYHAGQYTAFTDWRAHGMVDLTRALAVSSNVYFYYIGGGFGEQEGLGISRIEEYMRLFGFGGPTGIALAGEANGVVPSPAWKAGVFPNDPDWRIGNTYHTAIGQYGFQVTPLQAVRGIAAIANGGTLLTPRIETDHTQYGAREIGIAPEHLAAVRAGMREAVVDGTARGLNVSYVNVAGKTGTAELGYDKEYVHSWAVGFYPYEDPKYAFAVLMERGPRTNLIGGTYVMRQFLDWMHREVPEYVTFEE